MNVIFGLIGFLIIGLLAGFIANAVMKRRSNALLLDMGLGVAGAFVGGWILGILGFGVWGFPASLITATIGAIIILKLFDMLGGGNRRIRY